jgi:hypothetical protein
MKRRIRDLLDRLAGGILRTGLRFKGIHLPELVGPNKGQQIQLLLQYQELAARGEALPTFDDVGFRIFSQTDEDGILLYLFALLGMGGRRAVDIGAADGVDSNVANLVVHHNWDALMLEDNPEFVESGREFYRRRSDTWMHPPRQLRTCVTTENVNALLSENGFDGELDLLSIDIDGSDYWIWSALECARPRVVVVEYNNMWGPDEAVTVPNRPTAATRVHPDYYSASLAAFERLGRTKGYRLVGCNRHGFNAFFVREDQGPELLPAVSPAECLQRLWAVRRRSEVLPELRQLEWVSV